MLIGVVVGVALENGDLSALADRSEELEVAGEEEISVAGVVGLDDIGVESGSGSCQQVPPEFGSGVLDKEECVVVSIERLNGKTPINDTGSCGNAQGDLSGSIGPVGRVQFADVEISIALSILECEVDDHLAI